MKYMTVLIFLMNGQTMESLNEIDETIPNSPIDDNEINIELI